MKKLLALLLGLVLMMSAMALPAVAVEETATNTWTLTPVADASVGGTGWSTDSYKSTNYGSDAEVKFGAKYDTAKGVFHSAGTAGEGGEEQHPGWLAYFRFNLADTLDVNTQVISSAKIKLWYKANHTGAIDGAGGVGFWKVDDKTWTETDITYNNAPLKTKDISLDNSEKILPDVKFGVKYNMPNTYTAYEYDITDLIRKYTLTGEDATVNFAATLGFKYGYNSILATKEYSDSTYWPQLTIVAEEKKALAPESYPQGEHVYKNPLTVTFNNNLLSDSVSADDISLTSAGGPVAVTDVTPSANTLSVSADLKPFETYTLKIAGISDVFYQNLDGELTYTFNTVLPATNVTIGASKFKSASYDRTDPNGVGSATRGWYPSLYASGKFNDYYCVVDISDLAGKAVSKVIYKLYCGGEIRASLYKLDGDFTPLTTAYSALPQPGEVFATVNANQGNGQYTHIDITEYVRELLLAGKTKLQFVLKQNIANTTKVAGENTYSEWAPSIIATTEDEKYIHLASSTPSNGAENYGFAEKIELTFDGADIDSFTSANITLQKSGADAPMALAADEITFIGAKRKAIIAPKAGLEGGEEYTLTLTGLTSGDALQAETMVIKFTTVTDSVILSADGNKYTAAVYVGNNAADCKIIIAEYTNGGNRLVKIDTKEGTNDSPTISHSLTVDNAENLVKAFLWKADDSITPVTEPVSNKN